MRQNAKPTAAFCGHTEHKKRAVLKTSPSTTHPHISLPILALQRRSTLKLKTRKLIRCGNKRFKNVKNGQLSALEPDY
ncbi:hypothetical protein [Yoonia sp.]|uniref:hypothetical protein n=1 Tax=Yoonia sp. TaxID=2212373 RepID=UPI003F4AD6EC